MTNSILLSPCIALPSAHFPSSAHQPSSHRVMATSGPPTSADPWRGQCSHFPNCWCKGMLPPSSTCPFKGQGGCSAPGFPIKELERIHVCTALTARVTVLTFPCSLSDPAFGRGTITPRFTSPRKRPGDFISVV